MSVGIFIFAPQKKFKMRTKNIQIGWLKLRPKALTLQQIYDAGRVFRFKSDGQISITNAIAEMLANCDDAQMMQEITLVLLFRNKLTRWIMRPYIRHFTTVKAFREILVMLSETCEPALFITQIIQLRDTNVARLDVLSVRNV